MLLWSTLRICAQKKTCGVHWNDHVLLPCFWCFHCSDSKMSTHFYSQLWTSCGAAILVDLSMVIFDFHKPLWNVPEIGRSSSHTLLLKKWSIFTFRTVRKTFLCIFFSDTHCIFFETNPMNYWTFESFDSFSLAGQSGSGSPSKKTVPNWHFPMQLDLLSDSPRPRVSIPPPLYDVTPGSTILTAEAPASCNKMII